MTKTSPTSPLQTRGQQEGESTHRHKHLVMFEKVAESLYNQTKRQFGGDFTSSKAKSTELQGTDRFRDRHRLFVIKINRRITDIWNRTTFKNDQITITCDVQHIR